MNIQIQHINKMPYASKIKQREHNKKNINNKRLCIDHDHNTGIVRGLLCDKCNHLLGNATDSIKILLGAIKYLQIHENRKKL